MGKKLFVKLFTLVYKMVLFLIDHPKIALTIRIILFPLYPFVVLAYWYNLWFLRLCCRNSKKNRPSDDHQRFTIASNYMKAVFEKNKWLRFFSTKLLNVIILRQEKKIIESCWDNPTKEEYLFFRSIMSAYLKYPIFAGSVFHTTQPTQ